MNVIKELKLELVKAIQFLKEENKETFEATALTADQVKISDRVVGGKVELIGADGSLSDAPDGDYDVDGFKFTVKDGVIAAIAEEDTEDTSTEDTPADEDTPDDTTAEDTPDVQAQIDAIQAEVDGIKQILEQIISQLQDAASQQEMSKFSEEVKKLSDTIISLSKIPVQASKTTKKLSVKDSNDAALMSFIKSMNK